MASEKLLDRTEPVVIPRAHAPARSRLPSVLRVPILLVLNNSLRAALWSFAENFLAPELGAISVNTENIDMWSWSWYSPHARSLMNAGIVLMNWYFEYDFWDIGALTLLTNVPYAYLLTTYYRITTTTVAAHVIIEVLAISIPMYLLRARSIANNQSVPLRNRFLLNSVQVQTSNAVLAMGVYIVVLWAGLKSGFLNRFLVTYFDIPILDDAYDETPVSILMKTFFAGIAAKEFLLNPSIAAQPHTGAATPVGEFDPATATLEQTIKVNVLPLEKRTRTLFQQTIILNAFVFASTAQRLMTIKGIEATGAAGYAGVWVSANVVIALWYAWVGDTSSDYEPL